LKFEYQICAKQYIPSIFFSKSRKRDISTVNPDTGLKTDNLIFNLGIVQKLPSVSHWRKGNTLLSQNLSAKILTDGFFYLRFQVIFLVWEIAKRQECFAESETRCHRKRWTNF